MTNPTLEQLLEQTASELCRTLRPDLCTGLSDDTAEFMRLRETVIPSLRTLLSACHAGPLKGVGAQSTIDKT